MSMIHSTHKKITHAFIETLDLSAKEKSILDSLLSVQLSQNVSHIAKLAKLPRSTTLYILRKFERRKLVRKIIKGKRTYWLYRRSLNQITISE